MSHEPSYACCWLHKAFSQLFGRQACCQVCTLITFGAYIAGNVTSSVYPAGYGRALGHPHVSIMKTATYYNAWLLV